MFLWRKHLLIFEQCWNRKCIITVWHWHVYLSKFRCSFYFLCFYPLIISLRVCLFQVLQNHSQECTFEYNILVFVISFNFFPGMADSQEFVIIFCLAFVSMVRGGYIHSHGEYWKFKLIIYPNHYLPLPHLFLTSTSWILKTLP